MKLAKSLTLLCTVATVVAADRDRPDFEDDR